MADAIASAYRTAVASQAAEIDPTGLTLVESNIQLAELLPTFMTAVEQLLRRHIVTATKPMTDAASLGYDSSRLCVGFVDLVGSTALAQRLEMTELSAALSEFETVACDAVVGNGGRVVKLIGDEIMFTDVTPDSAVHTALAIGAELRQHPGLPAVRAGLAYGDVLIRDGDCFGPTVNLAARLAGVAQADQIIVDASTAGNLAEKDLEVEQQGERRLKGFATPVTTFTVQLRR
jgi:adenylate cyclase